MINPVLCANISPLSKFYSLDFAISALIFMSAAKHHGRP